MKQIYIITTGETGNEIGHSRRTLAKTETSAVASARRDCAAYRGDGWWTLKTEDGELIAKGGRK
jgi:hypothetical protein